MFNLSQSANQDEPTHQAARGQQGKGLHMSLKNKGYDTVT